MVDDNGTTETEETETEDGDELANIPPERLAGMLRDKRKSEAALRGRLRDAEGERDTLSAAVEAHHRDSLARIARAGKVHEAAVAEVIAGIPMADVLGESGAVDESKVAGVLAELKTVKPYLFDLPRIPGRSSNGQDTPSGGSGGRSTADWSGVLRA